MSGQSEERLAHDLLLVDDNEVLLRQLTRAFERRGFLVRQARSPAEAMALANEEAPELAVVDLRMPDGSGLELVKSLMELGAGTSVLVLTGYGSIATAVDAMRLGAVNYLQKPADADDILAGFGRAEKPVLDPGTPDYEPPSLARAEWEHIHRVLSDCGGNISEAARRLKIHRRSLQRKLNKYAPP